MRVNPKALRSLAFVFILAAFTLAPALAQRVPKKPVSYDAYDSWRSIQGAQISRDGVWLAYTLAPQDGDGELIVRNLPAGKEWRLSRGSGAVITADAKFVVYSVAPPKADVEKAKKQLASPGDYNQFYVARRSYKPTMRVFYMYYNAKGIRTITDSKPAGVQCNQIVYKDDWY